MAGDSQPKILQDSVFAFDAGMNAGVMPLLLPANQLANAINCTVRGTFVTHRPSFRRMTLDFGNDVTLETNFTTGKWQGGCYYGPDNASGTLMAAISGRLFQLQITGQVATVAETASVAPDPTYPNPVAQEQAWLWQAEKWVIYNDGISMPIFYDNAFRVRSNYLALNPQPTTDVTVDFVVPPIGQNVTPVTVTTTANMLVGDVLTLKVGARGIGTFQVVTVIGANTVTLLNLTALPNGYTVPAAVTTLFSWSHPGAQLPPGRMGTYGIGRNWVSLVDGKQFVASDLVGGSSGTQAENYRDAVLQVTENLYLAGGGNFTVPGSVGDIKAMRFTATLDASLGQGPLQVLTPKTAFSCNAPVDRLTWQDITNPILTESLITNGGLSQNATVLVNGDMVFRSVDGVRSLILGRREANTWGTTPISREVETFLRQDSQSLLSHSSACVFDNRMLMTTGGITDPQGVYWRGLLSLNLDPVSSLRGKAPSVWEGLWTGINTLQLIVGDFEGVERCFAFTLNVVNHQIELYEILRDYQAYYDNDTKRIVWEFEMPPRAFGQLDPKKREQLCLRDGEIHVDNLLGPVDFEAYYRPDQWPCYVPWHAWTECAKAPDATKPETANYQPQFRPYMGLGQPAIEPCDPTNDRPLREGYTFQPKLRVTGHCRFLGARYASHITPQPEFAPMVCDAICRPEEEEQVREEVQNGYTLVNAIECITQNDGTVVPIITGNQQQYFGTYGYAPNIVDGFLYSVVPQQLNDGSYAPIADQSPHTSGPPPHRLLNISDGLWYDLKTITLNDGTVVPICDQTSHASPTGP